MNKKKKQEDQRNDLRVIVEGQVPVVGLDEILPFVVMFAFNLLAAGNDQLFERAVETQKIVDRSVRYCGAALNVDLFQTRELMRNGSLFQETIVEHVQAVQCGRPQIRRREQDEQIARRDGEESVVIQKPRQVVQLKFLEERQTAAGFRRWWDEADDLKEPQRSEVGAALGYGSHIRLFDIAEVEAFQRRRAEPFKDGQESFFKRDVTDVTHSETL